MSQTERYPSLEGIGGVGVGMLVLLAGLFIASLVTIGYLALTLLVVAPIVGIRRFLPGRNRAFAPDAWL